MICLELNDVAYDDVYRLETSLNLTYHGEMWEGHKGALTNST